MLSSNAANRDLVMWTGTAPIHSRTRGVLEPPSSDSVRLVVRGPDMDSRSRNVADSAGSDKEWTEGC